MSRRPNIILIVIDDLGWRDLSCYGSTFYESPRIDELASGGLRYSNAYASSPVCSPSRASLMSGKTPARVGVTQWIGGFGVGTLKDVPYLRELPENEYSLARALRDGGYQTWHVGKWHLGPERCWPERHGFDVNIGGAEMGYPPSYYSPYDNPRLPDGPAGEYLTDRLTDEAIALIRAAGDAPFFLNLWHFAVHTPIDAPADLVERFTAKARDQGLDIEAYEDGEPIPVWHQAGKHVRRRTTQSDPRYAAMIANLDWNIGRLIDTLREEQIIDDTLVIFTSDNGGLATAEGSPTTNAPLAEGKGWMEDGGVRVPFIVHWPKEVPGATNTDHLTIGMDVYPSVLQAASLPPLPEQHVDGISQLDYWRAPDPEASEDRALYWHYPHYSNQGGQPGAAMRRGRWKLIRDFESGRDRLYDLNDDIGEVHDLADRQSQIADRLGAELDAWLRDVAALMPTVNPVDGPWEASPY